MMSRCNNNNYGKDGVVRPRRKFSSSTTTPRPSCWSDLTDDIKVDILCRLQDRDLIASKFVCREWKFFISRVCIPRLSPPHSSAPFWGLFCFENPPDLDPDEEDQDPDQDPNARKYLKFRFVGFDRFYYEVFMRKEYDSLPTIEDRVMSLLPSPERDPSNILDCCNGLLLLASNSQYYVGNPATRQRLAIPVNSSNDRPKNIFHSSLVFDPSLSLDFKIVSFIRPTVDTTDTYPLALDIFSFKTGHWSSHVLSLEPHNLYGFEWIRQSVYFNGALYYMWKTSYLVCIDNVIFNGNTDGSHLKAWAIELPDRTTSEQHCGCIGHSLGCFYYSNRDYQGYSILVWMLVKEGENHHWVLRHKISINHDIVSNEFPSLVDWCKRVDSFGPRLFHPNDNQIIIAGPRVFIFYHLETKRVSLAHIPYKYNRSTILLDQNWIFPYSQCPLLLNNIASSEKGRG